MYSSPIDLLRNCRSKCRSMRLCVNICLAGVSNSTGELAQKLWQQLDAVDKDPVVFTNDTCRVYVGGVGSVSFGERKRFEFIWPSWGTLCCAVCAQRHFSSLLSEDRVLFFPMCFCLTVAELKQNSWCVCSCTWSSSCCSWCSPSAHVHAAWTPSQFYNRSYETRQESSGKRKTNTRSHKSPYEHQRISQVQKNNLPNVEIFPGSRPYAHSI